MTPIAKRTENQETDRGKRKTFVGVVESDKMQKTRRVSVERRVRHPFYEKVQTRRSKFYVHDEGNESRIGDLVEIASTRPTSRLKRWRLVRIVQKARGA
ncbi:MAG: 30S ribosomal protein S17 [Elusimicrobia bacterium]|nr:30S ribosomal protein S17 [Elusimicrobiota bacterium]